MCDNLGQEIKLLFVSTNIYATYTNHFHVVYYKYSIIYFICLYFYVFSQTPVKLGSNKSLEYSQSEIVKIINTPLTHIFAKKSFVYYYNNG